MFGGNRTCTFTVADALTVWDRVAAPNLRLAVDVDHVWWDRLLAESLTAARGRVLGYHFCDWLENRRLKTLGGLTPYEYICKIWTLEPDRFIFDPIHQMPGLNT